MPQNVGVGEQPFNAAIYKSSHNSYDRNESLAQQIDEYNIWQIELDIYDYEGDLKVHHACFLLDEAASLSDLLDKMVAESQTYTNKFTIIYLDLKQCIIANWGDDLNDRLKSTFIEALGQEHIYPSSDFINTDKDNKHWPSFQELVRRKQFWCVVVDWHDETPENAARDEIFFTAISDVPAKSVFFANTVLVCLDGGCNGNTTNFELLPKDDRWIYRAYPSASCASDCGQQDGDYWTKAVANKYTLVATNCVNRTHTFDAGTHSPSPLFVDNTSVTQCPVDGEGCEWGTHAFPYHDLADAIDRASSMVTLLIKSGEYELRKNSAGSIINKSLILKAVDGVVRIK